MKVCFYMTTTLNHYAGCEKYLIDTAKVLKNSYSDLDITIITMDDIFTEKLYKILSKARGLPYRKKSSYGIDDIQLNKQLGNIQYIKCHTFSELKKALETYDMVYSKNELLEALILKFLVGYRNIKRLVFGCHTALFYPNNAKFRNYLYTSWIYTFLTSGVDIFHVLNEVDKNILMKNNRKVTKIYNPINVDLFFTNLKNKSKINVDKEKYNIIWVGRLTAQKGINHLVDIINFLGKHPEFNIELHIIGEGSQYSIIEPLLSEFNFIKYHGYIENSLIPKLLTEMDLYIHTSLWESFGLTIVEANLGNIPVLAFNISGPNEIINNQKNGILVNSKEEYFQELVNFITKKNLIENSQDFIIEKFNDELIYAQLYQLFTGPTYEK